MLVSDGVSQFMDSDEIIGLVHYLVTKHKCKPSKVRTEWGSMQEAAGRSQPEGERGERRFEAACADMLGFPSPSPSLCAQVARYVVGEARKRWAEHSKGSADDCTAIIVLLKSSSSSGDGSSGSEGDRSERRGRRRQGWWKKAKTALMGP